MAGAVLRPADLARPWRGAPRLRRRGQPIPRLLRRHPDHQPRLRHPRGDRRGARAGRQGPALLDALPLGADGRAGRAHLRTLRDPGRQGVLHHVRHRGQRCGAAAGNDLPPLQPGPGPAQQLPRPIVHYDRDHGTAILVAHVGERPVRQLRARRLPPAQPVPRPGRRRLHRCLRRRPRAGLRHDDLGRRGRHDRRAHPGRRRLRHPARRLLRRPEEGTRQPRRPLHLRRGPDRLGPHRRALLGLPGPRHHPRPHDLRQGGRQRPRPRWRGRLGRAARLAAGELALHVRWEPAE